MEKFMLLFRGSDVYQPNQSPEALQALKEKMIHWVIGLSQSGQHVSSEPLETSGRHVSGINKIVTNTPFGELWEIVGGCTIIMALDIDEAVFIAKSCPITETGASIEIRPIQKIEM